MAQIPNPLLGAALDFFPPENKKLFGSTYSKNRSKKNEQAKPTEQLRTTPKLLIFDFDDGNQKGNRDQYYAMLPSRSPGFSNVLVA
jgi:hypothetical protein